MRKICFGNRSRERGQRLARIMSVKDTARRHGHNPLRLFYRLFTQPPDKVMRFIYKKTSAKKSLAWACDSDADASWNLILKKVVANWKGHFQRRQVPSAFADALYENQNHWGSQDDPCRSIAKATVRKLNSYKAPGALELFYPQITVDRSKNNQNHPIKTCFVTKTWI